MNKTKELAFGSMMIAVIGALVLADRMFSFFFEDIIVLLVPAVIGICTVKFGIKCACITAVSMIIICFLGNVTTWLYIPAGIVIGILNSIYIRKGKCPLVPSIFFFVLAEVTITLLIMPVIGINSETITKMSGFSVMCYVFMIVFVGFMEAWINQWISVRISSVLGTEYPKTENLVSFRIKKWETVVLSLMVIILLPLAVSLNGTVFFILMSVWSVSYIILSYFGFMDLIEHVCLKKGFSPVVSFFIVITFPVTLVLMGIRHNLFQ